MWKTRLDFLISHPWLAVLADANTAEWGVVDRKGGARITGLHETYREALDEAIEGLSAYPLEPKERPSS